MLRRWINLIEASVESDEAFWEAVWWVTRWVSGSIDDPDWDDSWCTMNFDEAMHLIAARVHSRYKNQRNFYRGVIVPAAQAKTIINTKSLPPNSLHFQSFTPNEAIATDFIRSNRCPKGRVRLIVHADIDPQRVLFGVNDLEHTPEYGSIADWHHQDEVFIDCTTPLPLVGAKIIR